MTSFQLTLTTAGTAYQLLALVRAIDSGFVDAGDMVLQIDDNGGPQVVLFGGPALSSTRYGQRMLTGDFSSHFKDAAGAYAQSDTNSTKVNLTVIR